jgi:MFS transporter, DHA3 family, macrolide efflux protein
MVLPALLSRRISGAPAFLLIAATQCLSLVASQMSGFAVGVWAIESTGQVLSTGVITSIHMLLTIAFSPIAGVWVDRYDRKKMLILGDMLSALGAALLFVMALAGRLELWHVYIEAFLVGIGQSIQQPAYAAIIGSLVQKSNLNRANSMLSFIEWMPWLVSPVLGGLAYQFISIAGILSLDLMTFALAILAFVIVMLPGHARQTRDTTPSMLRELRDGARYIFSRPSLRALVVIGFLMDVCLGLFYALQTPLVLARTGNDSAGLGLVLSLGAIGGVVALVTLSLWKTGNRQMVLSALVITGWGAGLVAYAFGRSVPIWAIGMFFANLTGQIGMTIQRSIWQSKVLPAYQGRVFALKRTLTWLSSPVTPLIAAVLADRWLEPVFRSANAGALPAAHLVGTGPGAGIALIAASAAVGVMICGALMALLPVSRNIEQLLPDHNQDAQTQNSTP